MALYHTQNISSEKLLTIAANILHKAFYDCTRLEAKRRYQFLLDGRRIFLIKLQMQDGSELEVNLSLEQSELRGKLNFSLFKQLVGQLLGNYARLLNEKQPLNTFSDEEQQRWVYLIPAAFQGPEHLNMLVLSANMNEPGSLNLELMFIDPEQFRTAGANAAAG